MEPPKRKDPHAPYHDDSKFRIRVVPASNTNQEPQITIVGKQLSPAAVAMPDVKESVSATWVIEEWGMTDAQSNWLRAHCRYGQATSHNIQNTQRPQESHVGRRAINKHRPAQSLPTIPIFCQMGNTPQPSNRTTTDQRPTKMKWDKKQHLHAPRMGIE
jgi:hypothetical protein